MPAAPVRNTRLCLLSALLVVMLAGQVQAAEQSTPYALSEAEKAGRRSIEVPVYGDDPCPTLDDGTIIVCARKPEAERYRIPKEVRAKDAEEHAVAEQGWGSRAMAGEDVSRKLFLPNSCSPFGAGGFTGCTQAMFQQWYAERRAAGKLRSIGQD